MTRGVGGIGGRAGRAGGGNVERYLPLGYFVMAVLLVVVLLPTVLRPPPPEQNQTAQLSPDAPPDPNQQSIIATLNRASSGTAGTGEGEDVVVAPVAPTLPPRVGRSRSCPQAVGNPPRQVESLYATLCAPSFSGDNGGATYQGVTATEIRIAINGTNAGASDPCQDGRIPSPPTVEGGECASDRTFRVFMEYFNKNFQFYGRQLQFYAAQPATTTEEDVRTAAVKGAEQWKVFAAGGMYQPGCSEYARRKLVALCAQLPKDEYDKNHPYIWSFHMDGTELADMTAEYICKRLVGKPANHTTDAFLQGRPRKFGLIYFSTRDYVANGPRLAEGIERCGGSVLAIAATPDTSDASGQAGLATALTRFKSEGITTVIPAMDAISQIALTNTASGNAYSPEWIVNGAGANTANAIAQLMNQQEWANAFGITPFEAERKDEYHDCYRAYRSIDPDSTPNYTVCKALFPSYLQIANAIQNAGPILNPTTFAQGLYKTGVRYYTKPKWAVGGGYTPGTHNYIHNAAKVWWSPTTRDPQNLNGVGAYLYEDGGQRHRAGAIPPADRAFETEGALSTPADASEFNGETGPAP